MSHKQEGDGFFEREASCRYGLAGQFPGPQPHRELVVHNEEKAEGGPQHHVVEEAPGRHQEHVGEVAQRPDEEVGPVHAKQIANVY